MSRILDAVLPPSVRPSDLALSLLAFVLLSALPGAPAWASSEYDEEPISYSTTPVNDPVARLGKQVEQGAVKLNHDPRLGYLPDLLKELKIPASSQTLVFSKTSFQRDLISPARPRALYFNDNVYVGFVQGGDVLEIASVDPKQGTVFYTLDQRPAGDKAPPPARQTHNCLQCHDSRQALGVPGLLLRSVFPDADGRPILTAGTFSVNQENPMAERWGGWYVTGTHGGQRHMGNLTAPAGAGDAAGPEAFDLSKGANVTDLAGRFDAAAYLTGHSDIAALMVMEHQAYLHNLLTKAGYDVRRAMRDQEVLNRALGEKPEYRSDSNRSRIKSACEPVVKYMLFSGEAALTAPVRGTTTFAQDFAAAGPRDSKGRSLRDLDLQTRLLKHPCSYLIYSEQFDSLPADAKDYIYLRLWEVLSGEDTSREFAHLTGDDRRAVLEILLATKPGLPAYWKSPG